MSLININIIIVIVGFIQCLGLLYIIGKKSRNVGAAKTYLMIYLSVLMLQLLLKGVSKVWIMENYLSIYQLAYELPFLYGPLVFLYTKNSLAPGKQNFKNVDRKS